jgi:hypothetical protein
LGQPACNGRRDADGIRVQMTVNKKLTEFSLSPNLKVAI